MDAIQNATTSLKKASKHQNISFTSLLDHLNGKTRYKKLGPTGVLIVEEDQIVDTQVLSMQEVGLSINLQQFKNESGETNSNKANTFLRRGTRGLLVVLIQKETS